MWYVNKDYILIHQTYMIDFNLALFCGIHEKYAMWKFIVDVVHEFVSSLQPDVGRGFLHVSNVVLFEELPTILSVPSWSGEKDCHFNCSEDENEIMILPLMYRSRFHWQLWIIWIYFNEYQEETHWEQPQKTCTKLCCEDCLIFYQINIYFPLQ